MYKCWVQKSKDLGNQLEVAKVTDSKASTSQLLFGVVEAEVLDWRSSRFVWGIIPEAGGKECVPAVSSGSYPGSQPVKGDTE